MRGMPRANMVGTMNQLTAIILAAGEAKRMRSARPKVLHSLCGRPLIAYPLAGRGRPAEQTAEQNAQTAELT